MTATVKLYLPHQVLDSLNCPTESSSIHVGELEQASPASLSQAELVSLFENTTEDYLGFVDAPQLSQADLDQLLNLDPSQLRAGVALLPFSAAEPLIQVYQILPPLAAALSMNPLSHAVLLIRKADFLSLKDLPDSPEPIWQTLILLAKQKVPVELIELENPLTIKSPFESSLPELAPALPGRDRKWLLNLLRGYDPRQDLTTIESSPDATALKAGLLCLHDYLDESHEYSQSVQSQGRHRAGDYWHHIMHRREPDYSNAKYWSRAVGYHPLHDELPTAVAPLFERYAGIAHVASWQSRLVQNKRWLLNAFVDCCQECETTADPELNAFAKQVQWLEMLLLLQKTSLDAVSS
ncbi:hypothetical protein [Gimesia sp.]|uniref:hypothetical protein n=1 Tax=Gimesia sp. TaxID=2024833 RepID=UPI003A94C7C5